MMEKEVAAPSPQVTAAVSALRASTASEEQRRLLTRYFLQLISHRAPGRSVELRVPPYGAVQVVAGGTHTRGRPRAVVETTPQTFLQLALGQLGWDDAIATGQLTAWGERSDLSGWLPLWPVETTESEVNDS